MSNLLPLYVLGGGRVQANQLASGNHDARAIFNESDFLKISEHIAQNLLPTKSLLKNEERILSYFESLKCSRIIIF